MTSASVRLSDQGRLEVVRRSPPEDPVRMARTIERLQLAAGTGVVDLVGVETGDEGELTVVLAHAGAPVAGPMATPDAVRLGASVAATLADLHSRGIVHGALSVEHVLRDAAGAVRLCGLGHGEGAPADDVAALGVLLRSLLDERDTSTAARDVRVLLDRCTVDDPLARPTAGAVAASLAASAPTPRTITRPPALSPRTRGGWREVVQNVLPRPNREWRAASLVRPIAITVAAIGVAIAVGITLARWPRASAAQTSTTAPVVETTSSTSARRAAASTTTAVAARRVWPSAPAHVLHADGTWTFGTDDDHVVVGDWDCDGVETPALVQPDGDVYVIDAWTDGATARFVTTVAGAHDARVEPNGSCDRLVIETGDGRTVSPTMDGS